jgi:putative membrane protein
MKTITALTKLSLLTLAVSMANALAPVRAADATTENRGQLSKADYKFACEAARGGLMEVRAGELARDKATDPAVKQFGARMVTDHTKANARLQAIAMQKGATLPTDLDAKDQRHLEHLQGLSGADFDKAYAKSMVSDHEKDLKEFQKEAQSADDPQIKSFAGKTAMVIDQHLQQAKDMQNSVAGKTAQK